MLGENPQLLHHAFGNGRGQQGVVNGARRQKGAETQSNANESMEKWLVQGDWIVRSPEVNVQRSLPLTIAQRFNAGTATTEKPSPIRDGRNMCCSPDAIGRSFRPRAGLWRWGIDEPSVGTLAILRAKSAKPARPHEREN